MPRNKVVIHIRSGTAEIISKSKGVDVIIRDFDIDGTEKICRCGGEGRHFHTG